MKKLKLISCIALLCTYCNITQGQAKSALKWTDIPSWNFTRTSGSSYSNNGQWFASVAGPTEGDLTLTIRKVIDTARFNYPIGGQSSQIIFSQNSNFVGFMESPKTKEIKALVQQKKTPTKKLRVVSLQDTSSVVFENVKSFTFSADDGSWLAVSFSPTGQASNTFKGADLLLYNLLTKKSYNIGNVSDYSFNKAGSYLAFTVDAAGENGNGVFIRDMKTGLITALANDKASFSKINWNEEGTAFTLIKSKKEKGYRDLLYTAIAVKDLNGDLTKITQYNGLANKDITEGFGISSNSTPYWSKDLKSIFFGIAKIERDEKKEIEKTVSVGKKDTLSTQDLIAKQTTDSTNTTADSTKITSNKKDKKPVVDKKSIKKPDMIIWNWQDKRLQSAQKNQLMRDKNFNALGVYHIDENRFVQLGDSIFKSVQLAPSQQLALSYDISEYELESNLNGQSYADIYLVDVHSGQKQLLIKKFYMNASRGGFQFAPNSEWISYYQDGAYYVMNLKSLKSQNITAKIQSSFIDNKSDHNIDRPATPSYGWTADSKYLLIRDNNDLWKISQDGQSIVQLTANFKKSGLVAQGVYRIYEKDKNIDLKKDQYFGIFDDKTKNSGIGILAPGTQKIKILFLDSNRYGLNGKAEEGSTFFFNKQSSTKSPEVFASQQKTLDAAVQLTSNTPDQNKFAFSSGVRLISYVNDFGDTLQASLYLPANYVEGKTYPTITYIYERLTDELNAYSMPAFPGGGFNRAMYTSNGYAVLMPDITYQLNQPGMSAVACVVPAVKAAIATGIVDEKNVGIHGHSWGGYQTSFLITQTNIFKAAAAGAALTNMISMYSLIYWNSGSSNQAIFESSQGRLTTGYWDNWEAYAQNSPIFHIKKVNTPLLLLHNDKDGAVDYTQGIEYYNGLRRLNKPVVMLTYNGENHGLVKEENKKDYAVRMMEYFDHFLKNEKSPDWWEKGVDLIDMDKHLEERAF
ncbi:alpha/beta hydrolase family protein [Sphingobacterium sp. SYP-B4668]|uniref:alpha/beta hydrolase family protein n=1 Tax=Sphingobacterium sp. SYP-B4668 TaxID=2996035 RepID=UPI0022DDD02D|nr:prolyl oligopeptidase family serine peptidase [Sphingobacterium sp. SYP-B4668]